MGEVIVSPSVPVSRRPRRFLFTSTVLSFTVALTWTSGNVVLLFLCFPAREEGGGIIRVHPIRGGLAFRAITLLALSSDFKSM